MQQIRVVVSVALVALGCSEPAVPPGIQPDSGSGGSGGQGGGGGEGDAGGMPMLPSAAGIGEACEAPDDCRPGLSCEADGCRPAGTLEQGNPCFIGAECGEGLQCVEGACLPIREDAGAEGTACTSDLDCERGLRCAIQGFSVQCAPEGEADAGAMCGSSGDCRAGLGCFGGQCVPPPPGLPPFLGGPFQTSLDCAEGTEGAPVRAYFDLPGAPGFERGDFFRRPWPNDAAVDADGKPDFEAFPTPGDGLLGFDPVQRYVDAITRDFQGWSASPTTIFRFSGPIDFNTFRTPDGEQQRTRYVDVTPGSDDFGRAAGHGWFYFGGGTGYVCPNWFAVRRGAGLPLKPGHTYAVWLTRGGRDAENRAIERSPHFEALMSDDEPGDAVLRRAWTAYQPLRDFLAGDPDTRAESLLVASVFTVAPVRDRMAEVAAAARAQPVPEAVGWVRCAADGVSPCPQAEGDRACRAPTETYEEYHALVTLPTFQHGTAPYLNPEDGGDVRGGQPAGSEQVCVSVTVPLGEMPEGGWPTTVFAHGSGGSFRTHVQPAVAGALTSAGIPGDTVPMMVVGFDQVQHGTRRGGSDRDPKDLFFNFTNPAAARGNPIQGGADQVSIGRWVAQLDVSAEDSGGRAFRTNPEALVFFGQSQGSLHGSLGVPYAPEYRAVVLSGNGAGLIPALVNKRNPVDIARAVPFVLNDADANGDLKGGDGRHMHPILTLLQHWTDPADPLNFAELMALEPPEGSPARHVFQPYGLGDTFTPNITMRHYAIAARLGQVDPDRSAAPPDELGIELEAPPVAGNFRIGGVDLTLAIRQYGPPEGVDGHHVSFEVPAANSDVARFLGMSATGLIPQVGR